MTNTTAADFDTATDADLERAQVRGYPLRTRLQTRRFVPFYAWNAYYILIVAENPGPAIWHGAAANPGVLSQKASTKNGIIRPAIIFLVWVH